MKKAICWRWEKPLKSAVCFAELILMYYRYMGISILYRSCIYIYMYIYIYCINIYIAGLSLIYVPCGLSCVF